jgi:hypothetical protein
MVYRQTVYKTSHFKSSKTHLNLPSAEITGGCQLSDTDIAGVAIKASGKPVEAQKQGLAVDI